MDRHQKRTRSAILILIAVLVTSMVVAGCGGKKAEDKKTKNPVEKAEQIVNPQIKIVSPANGETLLDGNVKIEVNVLNFQLAEMFGKGNTLGTGHIHYIIDGGAPIPSASTNMQVNLTPGEHTVKVELHQNDHSPLDPPVEAVSTFSVSS